MGREMRKIAKRNKNKVLQNDEGEKIESVS